jgi:hypothetical protein
MLQCASSEATEIDNEVVKAIASAIQQDPNLEVDNGFTE